VVRSSVWKRRLNGWTGRAGKGAMSPQNVTPREVAAATIIDSPDRAVALADHLLDPARSRPVVVVTAAAGQSRPYVDVDEIIGAVSGLADVYVLPTGSITLAMSDRLPERTQVYGGAGRVYPVDPTWQRNPYAAPLRFAWGAAQGPVATEALITDALGAVHAAGLDAARIGATVVQVQGAVKALFDPSRAWVRTDEGRDATIWQDLLLSGLALERVFRVGMRISGALDVEEGRIDASASLRKPGEALADYAVGTLVLGRVIELDDISALVELYPGVRTGMSAGEVTGNPLDRLTTLMSVAEVLPVRVTARGGHDGRGWRLSALDVEDSEEILASPSLLADGPPWLVMAEAVPESALGAPASEPALPRTKEAEQPEALPVGTRPPIADVPLSASEADVGPVPALLADEGAASLGRQIVELEELLHNARTFGRAVQVELDEFRTQASESYNRVQQLVRSATNARTDLRLEKQKSQRLEKQVRSAKMKADHESNAGALFLDPVEQFRYEVDLAYARRIPAADKVTRRRRELRVGPDFLATLSSLEGVDRGKVVAVTVEIITDLVNELGGREPHPLREGDAAAAHDVVRTYDGARCMRVSLQRKTPSARRLHYWKTGDAIELSRVVKHDDMTP
jgi:hypothetical protein